MLFRSMPRKSAAFPDFQPAASSRLSFSLSMTFSLSHQIQRINVVLTGFFLLLEDQFWRDIHVFEEDAEGVLR